MSILQKIFEKERSDPGQFFKSVNDVPSVQKPKIKKIEPASEDEVRKIIMKAASKSCDLHPIPTNILHPLTAKLFNLNFQPLEVESR